ncbi:UNVERIFIED_ORG: hypothetical protein GGD59_002614 [Rhizobium esperanzae]
MRPNASTRMPSCVSKPALSARLASGRTPIPTTTASKERDDPSSNVAIAAAPSDLSPARPVPSHISTPWERCNSRGSRRFSGHAVEVRGAISTSVTATPGVRPLPLLARHSTRRRRESARREREAGAMHPHLPCSSGRRSYRRLPSYAPAGGPDWTLWQERDDRRTIALVMSRRSCRRDR